MSDALKTALEARSIEFRELSNGDIAFLRPYDGQSMYVRPHADGTYEWSQNSVRGGKSLLDVRPDSMASHRRGLSDVLQRVDDFMRLVVSGRVVIDTLGMVRKSMEQGMGRANAERIAAIARNFALEMHDSGMDADEIRTRFEEIHTQLQRERLGQLPTRVGPSV